MPKLVTMDPDDFHPFSAIPFHNNPQLRYRFANLKTINFMDKNHINVDTYAFKNFHYSYDHGNKKQYTYNWVNSVPSHNNA